MLSLYDFNERVAIKTERSTLSANLFTARAAIGLRRDGENIAMFGYGAGRDPESASIRARFELYERLFFMASSHSPDALLEKGSVGGKLVDWPDERTRLKDFVYGATGPHAPFGGNGTAVHTDVQSSIANSIRELLERHLCCQFWYQRAFSVERLALPDWIDAGGNSTISLYGVPVTELNACFVISIASSSAPSFFPMGAALRPTIEDATEHAFSETAMLADDFIVGRNGPVSPTQSARNVLSLRDSDRNQARREYFEALLKFRNPDSKNRMLSHFHVNTVTFKSSDGIIATRSFSPHLMDPESMKTCWTVPTLPLC